MAIKATSPKPEGMPSVTAHLWFNGDCDKALKFYQQVMHAEVLGEAMPFPDGSGIMHAMIKIGDTVLMLADAQPNSYEQGPHAHTSVGMFCYVDDCDTYYNRAVNAGCTVVEEMMDAFWGDRNGKVKDPFGHTWAFATSKWIYTPEEIEKNMQDWLATMNG